MSRSKLQIYVTILQTLADYGELISTHIIYNTNLNCASSKEFLGFLLEHNLIQELIEKKRKVYAITDLGLKALRLAKEIDGSLHVFNEEIYS
jgi:predicted transcriptional regulator